MARLKKRPYERMPRQKKGRKSRIIPEQQRKLSSKFLRVCNPWRSVSKIFLNRAKLKKLSLTCRASTPIKRMISRQKIMQSITPLPPPLPPLQLPQHISNDILRRLSAKSLVRFRCVSKSWSSLITSCQFIESHLTQDNKYKNYNILSSRNSIGILHYEESSSSSSSSTQVLRVDFPLQIPYGFQVIGSCNGLLLCLVFNVHYLVLWNPSIRYYMRFYSFYTEDDVYGFGYDSCSDDYKVVKLYSDHRCKTLQVEIFSSTKNLWRKLDDIRCAIRFTEDLSGTYVNGAIYWRVYLNQCLKILRFDLGEEKFMPLPMPVPFEDYGKSRFKLGVHGGCPCLFQNYQGSHVVWVFEEEDLKEVGHWSKLMTIPQQVLPQQDLVPISFTKKGEILMSNQGESRCMKWYEKEDLMMQIYNPKDKRFEKLITLDRQWSEDTIYTYTETLVSPYDLAGEEVQAQRAHRNFVHEFRQWLAKCNNKEFSFTLEPTIFGFEQLVYLFEDDVAELCRERGQATSAMFVLYMRNLYTKMKKNGVNCIFVCPEWNSLGSNMLAERLDKSTVVIVPVYIANPWEHWCLVVIVSCVEDEHVFWFDSLNIDIEYRKGYIEKIESAINEYWDSSSAAKKKIIWEQVECPKQAGNWECGFYVMMFMRDIFTCQKSISFTKDYLESYLTHHPTERSVLNDINRVKRELLLAYRELHPEK